MRVGTGEGKLYVAGLKLPPAHKFPEAAFPVDVKLDRTCHRAVSYESRFAFSANDRPTRIFAMRISGGKARGIPLMVPKGDVVRPATDGMRQAVFSSLGERVNGARFLDLFAGSGAYGLEALSRGAAGGLFIEQNKKAISCLRENIAAVCKSVGANPAELEVLQLDAVGVPLGTGGEVPDLVFIDPPYEIISEVAGTLFARLSHVLATKPDALVVFELPGELELNPAGWTMLKRLGKGARQPTVAFFRASAAPPRAT
jgi:16S rRNA (guanine966-N2)-methyltransferase